MLSLTMLWTVFWLSVSTTLAILQAPTPDQVSAELAGLLMLGLGALSSVLYQFVKKVLTPLTNASPVVKAIISLVWGYGVAWISGRVPALGQILPADPSLLGDAVNGLLLWAVMQGAYNVKKLIAPAPL